jgi:hypothetical protein
VLAVHEKVFVGRAAFSGANSNRSLTI